MLSSNRHSAIESNSAFCAKVEDLVREIVIQKDMLYYRIESKVEHLADAGGEDNFMPVIRIITYFEDTVSQISDLLNSEFDIIAESAVDKKKSRMESFSYKHVQYLVRLKANRRELTEYKRQGDKKFEIQICSMLQDAWAGIEKELGYDSSAFPEEGKRDLYRVGALLEMADLEFLKIRSKFINNPQTAAQPAFSVPAEPVFTAPAPKELVIEPPVAAQPEPRFNPLPPVPQPTYAPVTEPVYTPPAPVYTPPPAPVYEAPKAPVYEAPQAPAPPLSPAATVAQENRTAAPAVQPVVPQRTIPLTPVANHPKPAHHEERIPSDFAGTGMHHHAHETPQASVFQAPPGPVYHTPFYHEPQAPVQQAPPAPVYEAPPAPVYQAPPAPIAPVYEAPPAPVYHAPQAPAAPVYEAPPAPVYQAPPAPVAPVYEAPAAPVFQAPPVAPVYQAPPASAAPVYEAPQAPVYEAPAAPVFQAPPAPAAPVFEAPVAPIVQEVTPVVQHIQQAAEPVMHAPEAAQHILEQATPNTDSQPFFEDLLDEQAAHKGAEAPGPLDENAPITDQSLREYVMKSKLLKEIDSQIAERAGARINSDIDIEGDVERLRFLKVYTLKQLHDRLTDNKDDVVAFAEKWIGKDNGGSFDSGISLFYLEYLLVGKKNDPAFAVEYVVKFISDNDYSARYIIPTYNSIRNTEAPNFSHLTLK